MTVEIYRRVGAKKLEKFIAELPGVQASLQDHAEQVARRAEANLAAVRADAAYTGDLDVEVTVDRGRIDRYVNLDDTRGEWAALSIEFGRESYTYQRPTKDGGTVTVTVAAMDGKYILTDAANLPIRKKKRR